MGRKASINAEEILDTAEAIVINEGSAHLTFENIAQKLGITKGGVQYSFASKDAIIERLINRWNDSFDIEMAKHMPENPAPAEYIRAHIKATHVIDKNYNKGAGLMAALMDNRKFREITLDWYQKRLAALAQLQGAEKQRLQLAFWACEGVFLLTSFGFTPCSGQSWNAVFNDINHQLLN